MQRTKIEYLDFTYNPIAMRCTPVSSGCSNCWHLRMANRMSYNPVLRPSQLNAYSNGVPSLRTKELSTPLRRKKPARIGPQYMGDLFHESIPFEWIAAIYGVMAASPQHQFFILTKRPERRFEFFKWVELSPISTCFNAMDKEVYGMYFPYPRGHYPHWPLQNVLEGTSVEDQKTAEERWNFAWRTPAAHRWVSYEPALGELDLRADLGISHRGSPDLVVAGAETGPGARPAELDWFRSARDQCSAAGVPFFFKRDSSGSRLLDGVKHEELP